MYNCWCYVSTSSFERAHQLDRIKDAQYTGGLILASIYSFHVCAYFVFISLYLCACILYYCWCMVLVKQGQPLPSTTWVSGPYNSDHSANKKRDEKDNSIEDILSSNFVSNMFHIYTIHHTDTEIALQIWTSFQEVKISPFVINMILAQKTFAIHTPVFIFP